MGTRYCEIHFAAIHGEHECVELLVESFVRAYAAEIKQARVVKPERVRTGKDSPTCGGVIKGNVGIKRVAELRAEFLTFQGECIKNQVEKASEVPGLSVQKAERYQMIIDSLDECADTLAEIELTKLDCLQSS